MNCQNCGKELEAGQAFCSHCGQAVDAAQTSGAATSTNAAPTVDADGYPLHWVGSLPIWENFKMCMTKKYFTIQGRATRGEYWKFALVHYVIVIVAALIGSTMESSKIVESVLSLLSVALFMPSLAVMVRRLHDTNRSAWWLILILIPFIGTIAGIVLMLLKSNPLPNKYGPLPDYSNYQG